LSMGRLYVKGWGINTVWAQVCRAACVSFAVFPGY